MVVQTERRCHPEVVCSSAEKFTDDNNQDLSLGLLFNDVKHLGSENLLKLYEKLRDTARTLPETKNRPSSNYGEPHLRMRAVTVIRCLHLFFSGTSDVFATSVGILDKFISMIRIQEKYVSCVAAACYFISSKVYLEEEEIPTASELACLHGNRWTASDLCRMEMVVLEKLKWTVPKVNYLTFLRLFEKLFAQIDESSFVCSESLVHMTESLIKLNESTLFKPSTLAFCVFKDLIEKQEAMDAQIRTFLIHIQLICDIHDSELFECKDLLYQTRDEKVVATNYSRRSSSCFPFKIRSRPSSEGESELPPITEVVSC